VRQEELHLIERYEGDGLVVAGSARRIVNALEIFESSLERFADSRSAAVIAFRRIKNFACARSILSRRGCWCT
jgi:hypothetical protein